MNFAFLSSASLTAVVALFVAIPAHADDQFQAVVDAAVEPVMAEHGIPGMSVAVLVAGQRHVFHYGVASRETQVAVNDRTIFEIGSLSKPFTATLGAVLQAEGAVDLSASAQNLMKELQGNPIGGASLLELATYNAGGLPLQFPGGVDESNFADWYRGFEPSTTIGESRLYSNPSIGLFGHLVAKAAGRPFGELLRAKVLAPLELTDTFLTVPDEGAQDYAQGYTRDNKPVRVKPGLFDKEAYGIKTTAADFLRFVEASMFKSAGTGSLAEGLRTARSGVYRMNAMHQGLGWELYPAPARLSDLLQGADPAFVLEPNSVETVDGLVSDRSLVGTVSKTGSTGGFGAYALYSPERGTAIVMLANRFWSNPLRIKTAYAILSELDPGFAAH
ncbi:class C beta-lactamase [Pararhizobium haloflavum]|uniref:class C beta-lactamase n=1 Tax=Pararhizobium haloflavum TaxID=2037914 RepID=UPI000C18D0B8|nr:class C beta-lactamase [Pararhizobium haloflavum]